MPITRGHDPLPRLHELLVKHRFVAEEPESVMIGEAASLAMDVPLPQGITLRSVVERADIEATTRMQASVFGDPENASQRVESTMHQLHERAAEGLELWVAEADGQVVSAGRVDPVPETDFAGIWGGATVPAWRGRGIYRAMTAKRAQAALRAGKTLINSDSTEFSRPILERAGSAR